MSATNLGASELAEKRSKFRRKVEFLDSLLHMGEEDYEIEHEVLRSAALAGELLRERLHRIVPAAAASPSFYTMSAESLFRWEYLTNWSRRSSITRTSEPLLEGFFIQCFDELQADDAQDRDGIFFIISQLLAAIEEAGVAVNWPRREQQIQRCRRRIMKMKPGETRVN